MFLARHQVLGEPIEVGGDRTSHLVVLRQSRRAVHLQMDQDISCFLEKVCTAKVAARSSRQLICIVASV